MEIQKKMYRLSDTKKCVSICPRETYKDTPIVHFQYTSGTDPVDNLNFWASLAPKDREKRVERTKSMGNGLIRRSSCNQLTKREKLRKIAMVLYNAGEYDDSIWYSTRALEGSTEKSEDLFVTNALECRTTMCELKLPVYAPNAIRKVGSIYWKNWTS